jgi:hypothetical protein
MRYFLPIFLLIAVALVFSYPAMRAPQRLAVGSPDSDACDSLWLSWAFSWAIGEGDLSQADFTMLIDRPESICGRTSATHLSPVPEAGDPARRTGCRGQHRPVLIFFCNVLTPSLLLYVVATALPPCRPRWPSGWEPIR